MKKNIKFYTFLAIGLLLSLNAIAKENAPFDMPITSLDNQKLIFKLYNKDANNRYQAACELGRLQVAVAVEPLIELLSSDDEYQVRISAAKALFEIGDKRALVAINHQIHADYNKTVRNALTGLKLLLEQKN